MLQVRVREADNARDLASSADETDANTDGPRTKAVYELTALVAHIMGDAEEQERLKKKRERAEPGKAEGHIVAHIKASHPRHPPPPPPPRPTPAQTRDQLMVQGKTLELYMGAETPAAWHLRNWHFLYPLTIHEVLLVYGEYILCLTCT